jgi:protein-S-isoprenylcysteine O-methyltransferase Ste14
MMPLPLPVLIYVLFIALFGTLHMVFILKKKGKVAAGKSDPTFFLVTIPFLLCLIAGPVESVVRHLTLMLFRYLLGIVFLVAGAVFDVVSLSYLKSAFSTLVDNKVGQKLVTSGPYGIVRHPLYLSYIFIAGSSPSAMRSWFALGLFLCTVAGILIRIKVEERLMSAVFPGYKEYMKQTKGLIPGIY